MFNREKQRNVSTPRKTITLDQPKQTPVGDVRGSALLLQYTRSVHWSSVCPSYPSSRYSQNLMIAGWKWLPCYVPLSFQYRRTIKVNVILMAINVCCSIMIAFLLFTKTNLSISLFWSCRIRCIGPPNRVCLFLSCIRLVVAKLMFSIHFKEKITVIYIRAKVLFVCVLTSFRLLRPPVFLRYSLQLLLQIVYNLHLLSNWTLREFSVLVTVG